MPKQYPTPPFPEQQQPHPGLASRMDPARALERVVGVDRRATVGLVRVRLRAELGTPRQRCVTGCPTLRRQASLIPSSRHRLELDQLGIPRGRDRANVRRGRQRSGL